MKRQKGGILLIGLAGLVLVSGLVAASLSLTQQQAEQSRDDLRGAQGTAISDSFRLLILSGYSEEEAFSFLSGTLYEGNTAILTSSDAQGGKLSLGERSWGYTFNFSNPLEDLGDFYELFDPSTLPPQCSLRGNGSFVCNWQAGIPATWKFSERQDLLIERKDKSFSFSGVMRFPPNTQFILGKSVDLYFKGPVIFGGNFSVERNHPEGGNIYFEDSTAILGEFFVEDYLTQGNFLSTSGEIVFQKSSYVKKIIQEKFLTIKPDRAFQSLGNYRVTSPFYFGTIDWEGPQNLSNYLGRETKPPQVIFQEALISEEFLPFPTRVSWEVRGEKRISCGRGKKLCWVQYLRESKSLNIISISSFGTSSFENSNLLTLSGESLFKVASEPYLSGSWTIVNLDP